MAACEAGDIEIGADVLRYGQAGGARQPLRREVADDHELEAQRLHVVDQPPVQHVGLGDARRRGVLDALGQQVRRGVEHPRVHAHEAEEADRHRVSPGYVERLICRVAAAPQRGASLHRRRHLRARFDDDDPPWSERGPAADLLLSRSAISCRSTDLNEVEVANLLDLADGFVSLNRQTAKKLDLLKGRTLMNLFFENSTRTQSSFELAGKRLGADVVNMSPRSSAMSKGETLIDTAVTLNAMQPDLLVVRHASSGAASLLSQKVSCSVINAGDGQHEHPTQALLDALSMRRAFGHIAGLTRGDLRRRAAQPRGPLQRRPAADAGRRACGWSARRP